MMGLLKRRIIESEEPKEEPPMVDTDIVESLRYVAKSAKPMDAGQMREAANEIERLRGRVVRLPWTRGDWAGTVDMIAYRGMVADALDAAGVKWDMADE